MREIRRLGCILAVMAALGMTALPAGADPADDVTQLRQEMERMRQSMDVLEAKIHALEAQNAAPQVAPPAQLKQPSFSYVALQRDWSEVGRGTSKTRVEELLGKPERELRINGDLVWYFVYPGLGRGSVFFNSAGNVTATQPPRVSWSW